MCRLATALTKPIGRITHTLTVVAVLWLCWDARFPGRGLSPLGLGVLLWAWVLLVWSSRPLIGVVLRLSYRQRLRPLIAGWRHWCIVPLLLGINWIAIAYALPATVALRISRPAMDRVAQAVLANGQERPTEWVGILRISQTRLVDGVVELQYAGNEFLWGKRGLYFSPTGAPLNNSYYYSQQFLEDGWYSWHYGGW